MLRFRHKMQPQGVPGELTANGPEQRLDRLRQMVSGLIRYERIEPKYAHAAEARQYAERLIYLAIKNGDKHKHTMEMANYWLLEKDLIHKLFKVLVPRFQNSHSSFTQIHKKANEYPGGGGLIQAVLELKGNPYPPVNPHKRDTKFLLSNILLSAARKDFYETKKQLKESAMLEASNAASLGKPSANDNSQLDEPEEHDVSSSVDPLPSDIDSSQKR